MGIRNLVLAGLTAGAVILITVAVIVTTHEVTPVILVGVAGGATAAFVAFTVPTRYLPLLALIVFALIPQRLFPFEVLRVISPGAILLLIWAIRRVRVDRARALPKGKKVAISLALLFIFWCIATLLWSEDRVTSGGWIVSFTLAALGPLFIKSKADESRVLLAGWPVLGAILGSYAVLEFLTKNNFIYSALYRATLGDNVQHWETYRAHASFGHPLYAGMFFAVSTAVSVGAALQTKQKRYIWCALLSGAGVICTVSRGSYAATGVAVGAMLLVALVQGRGYGRGKALGLTAIFGIAAVIALNTPAFQSRTDSDEAAISTGQRDWVLNLALERASVYGWMGAGPGNSSLAMGDIYSAVRYIENSGLQLLLSVGIIGLLLVLLIVIVSSVGSIRLHNLSALGGLVAFTIAVVGYNALDDVKSTHLVLGLLLFLAWSGPVRDSDDGNPSAKAVAATPMEIVTDYR